MRTEAQPAFHSESGPEAQKGVFEARLEVQFALIRRDLVERGLITEETQNDAVTGVETIKWSERCSQAFRELCKTDAEFRALVMATSLRIKKAEDVRVDLDRIQQRIDLAIEKDPDLLKDEFAPADPPPETPAHPA